MSMIFGADSTFAANMKLTNGFNLYEWVVRKGCYPAFWGRSITGEGSITTEEIEFLRSKNCKIALILRDFDEEVISSNDGTGDAKRALDAATKLNIPKNEGIALFVDIPSDWSINHNWMMGFAHTIFNNGYLPGFFGNTDSAKNFNFNRQCSHYIQATREYNEFNAVYWSKEPKYDFDPNNWATYAPSEILPKNIHIWQYGTIEFHSIKAHKNYANNSDVLKCML